MDKEGTQTDEPKNKKIDDDTQSLTPKKDIDSMCPEEKEEEDSPALRIA